MSIQSVIIADDSGTARMFVKRCCEIAGLGEATIREASDGEAALALLKEAPSELVVTDLNMPNMDGTALLKRIKASPKHNDVHVIVVSSLTNEAKVQELTGLGALAVLKKPVSPPALIDALGDLVD